MTSTTASLPAPPVPRLQRLFPALAAPNFRLFAGVNVLAMTAMWMQRIAQDWLVLQLTGSVAAVGVTTAMQFGPMILFGLHGGVIVDRFSKRRLLLVTQSTVGLVSLMLAALVLTGTVQVWQVWVTAFLIGTVTVVDNPARQVFVNELVGPDLLRSAVTVNSAVFQFGGLLGPAVSGGLIAAVGGGWAFGINALACAVTVFGLSRLDVRRLHVIERPAAGRGGLREGLAHVARTPAVLWSVVLVGFLAVFTLTMPVLLVAYADHVFATGPGGYGLFNSLVAIGALAGAILSTRRRTIRLRSVILSGGVWAALQGLAALAPNELTFGIALVASGVANQFFFMAANPLIQLSTDIALRGRVMAVWILVLFGGQGIGGALMGGLVELVGPRGAMLVSGLVPALAATGVALVLARRGALRMRMHLRTGRHLPQLEIVPRSHTASTRPRSIRTPSARRVLGIRPAAREEH